jgi:hypothetical protein
VGGLYKDQGLDVVRGWITLLFKSRLETAYQVMRGEYLLQPVAEATSQFIAPASGHPPSHPRPPLPSGPAEDSGQESRRAQPPANQSQKGSGQARGGAGAHSEAVDRPGNGSWGRQASLRGGGRHDAGKQGHLHQEGYRPNNF